MFRAGEVTQWLRVLAIKSDSLGSISRIGMVVGGTNHLPQIVSCPSCGGMLIINVKKKLYSRNLRWWLTQYGTCLEV